MLKRTIYYKRTHARCCPAGMLVLLAVSLLMLFSCTSENYESGDGKYSYLRADFGLAVTDADKAVTKFQTDDGQTFTFTPAVATQWATVADTTYRALFYSNVADASENDQQAQLVASAQVPVLRALAAEHFKTLKTDPVTFESLWISHNGKYLNLSFWIKTGTSDGDDNVQTIGLIDRGIFFNADGTKCFHLQFYHDQGGVPEYYSSKKYVSIPLEGLKADSVRLTLEAYDGTVEKTFKLP